MGVSIRNGKIISEVQVVPKLVEPEPYKRPNDWLPISQFDSENKDEIYILNGVGLNCLNQIYFKLTVTDLTGATIDWGDGQTTTITSISQVTYNHKYNYEDLPDSSYTEHNKTKQALIHITANRGGISYFSTGDIQYQYTNADGEAIAYNTNISTDIYEINANVSESEVYCFAPTSSPTPNFQRHRNLEIFDWKGNIINISMNHMFYYCSSLQSIPQLDTSGVTDMNHMFYYCSSLQSIPQLDTSGVTDMSYMFYHCASLHSIPQLDSSGVTNMRYMFYQCYPLHSMPQLDTSRVTNMSYMFYYCSSLHSMPQLDTSRVTNMLNIFNNCHLLQTIPQLDASRVTNMLNIFNNCYSLTNPKTYNAGASSISSITLSSLSNSTMMTKQQLVDLFNSVCQNTVSGNTRTIQIGTTLQGYLTDCYVKDSGSAYTAILPTSDTIVDTSKTYYTYNDVTGEYTQFTGTTFEQGVFYYELKTATWNKYIICESTDEGAMFALDFVRNIKNWTVT